MSVTATGPDGAADTIGVTVAVTNAEEKGMAALLGMHPRVGAAATSIPADPDSGVTGTTRQGAESCAPEYGARTDINGATSGSGTSVENDSGQYLRVTATHTDGDGSGKTVGAMATNELTSMPEDMSIEILAGGLVGNGNPAWAARASDGASESKSGSSAGYYTFKLDRRKQVEMNLTTAADLCRGPLTGPAAMERQSLETRTETPILSKLPFSQHRISM